MNSLENWKLSYVRAYVYSCLIHFLCVLSVPCVLFSTKWQGHMGQIGHLFLAYPYYRARENSPYARACSFATEGTQEPHPQ